MVKRSVTLKRPEEIDRSAALLVQTASSFDSRIHVFYDNRRINAKSIMGVMTLPLAEGNSFDIIADGTDEEKAIDAMADFFMAD